MYTRGAAKIELEEDLKRRICELECQLRQEQEEILTDRVGMPEKIQQLKSELHAMRILLNAKEEQRGRSHRRSKPRVYFP